MKQFQLRLPHDEIVYWSTQYDSPREDYIEQTVSPRIRTKGFCSKEDFVELCRWKSPRIGPRCESNPPEFVEAVTRTALSDTHERFRVEALTLLSGASWPMASVILHWGHKDPYPILDFRALWSLGITDYKYNFDFWWAYTQYCRRLAIECNVTMRVLARALWAYSKVNQE